MLTVNQVKKSYGIETVLAGISFKLNPGERIGVVGPNGCGKTTLLRLIVGAERPDSGTIRLEPPNLRSGYLPQGFTFIEQETLSDYLNRMQGDPEGLSARLETLAVQLSAETHNRELQKAYDRTLAELALVSESAGQVQGVMAGLGLGNLPPDLEVARLSGGQKTRLGLAGVLLASPQLLLLDEPTNHLDFEMLEWLEDWLNHAVQAVLIVSHDRVFLDRIATAILEIDPFKRTSRLYEGAYGAYLEQKAAERERHRQAYDDQQREIARLRSAAAHLRGIAHFRKGGKADTGDGFARGFFANRGMETVRRAKHLERRLEQLMGDERVEKPQRVWQMKVEFAPANETGRDALVLENLSVGYGERVLLKDLERVVRYGTRLVLVGPNGCGKTTLLRTINGEIPALAGRVRLGSGVRLGYMAQEQETLNPALNALDTLAQVASLNETEARSYLSKYRFTGDDVFIPTGSLSYGERSRLMLACLAAWGCNLLLLDEPLNHLDIPSRASFEEALAGFEGTIIAVVHDRYFIEGFATQIWEVNQPDRF